MLGIIGLFAFVSVKLADNQHALKVFFMLLAFTFVIVGLVMIREIAAQNYSQGIVDLIDTMYVGYLYLYTFLVLFFILQLGFGILSVFTNEKKAKEDF